MILSQNDMAKATLDVLFHYGASFMGLSIRIDQASPASKKQQVQQQPGPLLGPSIGVQVRVSAGLGLGLGVGLVLGQS